MENKGFFMDSAPGCIHLLPLFSIERGPPVPFLLACGIFPGVGWEPQSRRQMGHP